MATKIQTQPNSSNRPRRKAFGFGLLRSESKNSVRPKDLNRWLKEIRVAEQQFENLSDTELASRATQLRELAEQQHASSDIKSQFGGLVSQAVYRTCGFYLHDVQVKAIAAGSSGAIVEMHTGEGKTIVTGALAAMKTLTSPGVHVGTTNTYLAERDLESTRGLFQLMGITSGLLPEESNENQSRRVYRNQVVYGPGYQYGFDYLRDQMTLRMDSNSQLGNRTIARIRGIDERQNLIQPAEHHTALIDEADSVMIDEAMTPLVISLPAKTTVDPMPYQLANKIAKEMVLDADYTIELPHKTITVHDDANQRAHDAVANEKRLQLARPWRIYISNALRAINVLVKDIDYVVVDGKVQIVDQNTGRIFADRTWQDGLHQAVEAKENVEIQPGRESTTQITRQRYLQMYTELAGLTGTASSVRGEFKEVYGCPVIEIPTNKKCLRQIMPTRFFASQEAKLSAIADEVLQRHRQRQPILVGTRTIKESHEVNDALKARGLDATVLNGVQDADEADIVAVAGIQGALTIATNMAGRGTDIKPDKAAIAAGGLHVIGVTPNASKRIDRQLVGRAARQGQPGSAQFFAAATDSLFVDNQSALTKRIARRARASGESANFRRELSDLQDAIEERNFKQRQQMILRDCWMDKVREAIVKQ